MHVHVIDRDGLNTTHRADVVEVIYDEDVVRVVETHEGPNGTSYRRTSYLRESIARIVEPDYDPVAEEKIED